MNKDIDCIVCGSCVVDILVRPIPLQSAVGAGKLIAADPIAITTGGIVSNAGIAMARLGMRAAAFSYVGDDRWGQIIRDRYQEENVAVDCLMTHPTWGTSTTAVLIDKNGERSFAHAVGAPKRLDSQVFLQHADYFARSRSMLLGYYSLLPNLESELPQVLQAIQSVNCLTAMDAAGDGGSMNPLSEILPHLDIYIPSLNEARHQTGESNTSRMIECYRDHGAKGTLGIKLGSRGALLSSADGKFLQISAVSPPGDVVDTTGAGDCFYAGLLTGLLRGMDLQQCGQLACAAGAACVTEIGASTAMADFARLCQLAGIS